jgi:hypothetical protein
MAKLYLNTPIAQIPKLVNDQFLSTQRYMDSFFDGSLGIVKVPVETAGRVKAARGEFVTSVVDNLVVRNQYTNLYQNITTADADFYTAYIQGATSPRVADPSVFENTSYKYVDVNKPYYKIINDYSVAFSSNNLGQQIQILLDPSTGGNPFKILMDPSIGGGQVSELQVLFADAGKTWLVLIAVDFDASFGTTWAVKQYGGDYSIVSI